MQRDFAPHDSNQAPDSSRIRYQRLMPMIGFQQGSVDVFFGYTTFDCALPTRDARHGRRRGRPG